MHLAINDTFKNLIPALTIQEYATLENSIKTEGCRDAIIHWQGVIVDGHNRYAICQQHSIPFNTIERDFENEIAAKIWICDNALARRNLSDIDRIATVRNQEVFVIQQAKERMLAGKKQDPVVNLPQGKTRDVMADKVGVSGKTYEKAITILDQASTPIIDAIRSNDVSIHDVYEALKSEDLDTVEAALVVVQSGEANTLKKAIKKQKQEDRITTLSQPALTATLPDLIILIHGDMMITPLTQKFDCIIADPPYNVTDWQWDQIGDRSAFIQQSKEWITRCISLLNPIYTLFWFCAPCYMADIEFIIRDLGLPLQSRLVWHRRNMAMGSNAKYKFLDSWECIFHIGNKPLNFDTNWHEARFDPPS